MYIHTCTHTHVYTCININTYMHIDMSRHVSSRACVHRGRTSSEYTLVCVCACVCVCVCVCDLCVCVSVCVCVHVLVHHNTHYGDICYDTDMVATSLGTRLMTTR